MSRDTEHLKYAMEEYHRLLRLAREIVSDAPFHTTTEEHFTVLGFKDEEMATLTWPEMEGGYYDSYSMEKQTIDFPMELLLMSPDELKVWKVVEKEKYDVAEKIRMERESLVREKAKRLQDLTMLADLLRKYPS